MEQDKETRKLGDKRQEGNGKMFPFLPWSETGEETKVRKKRRQGEQTRERKGQWKQRDEREKGTKTREGKEEVAGYGGMM